MEGPNNLESKEGMIDRLIEELAERESMDANDIWSDIVTFSELEDAEVYTEEVLERINAKQFSITSEELVARAREKVKE